MLLVPMRDREGKLWNVTRIFTKEFTDEKTGESRGNKFVLKGGRKEGLFHLLGCRDVTTGPLCFAEGFATAASIAEAFPKRIVIACFDAGNLGPATEEMLGGLESPGIEFWGDEDCYKPEKGNPGREAASGCAERFSGRALFPRFRSTQTLPTDWNDLRCLEGLESLHRQYEEWLKNPVEEAKAPEPIEKDDKRNIEASIVRALIDNFGDTLIKQDRDIFEFNGSHWIHYTPRQATDHFLKVIDARTGERLSLKMLKQVLERFSAYIPHVPRTRNMFAPPPFVTNFKNGALELLPKPDGCFDLKFRPKLAQDLLCYSHPFDYTPDAERNPEFEQTLERVLPGGGIETYLEVLGGCLLPAFPKVVFFIGPPGSGKSTLILFAYHLIDRDLRCSVDPSDWKGFGMETMAGKLLNLLPDISLSRPISESMLKLIEDRVNVRIQRKGITDLMAPVPALHLFGGNALPRTQENVDAFTRRTLVFRCDRFKAPDTGFIRDYAHHVWDRGPGGIVAQAISGLKRVASNKGHYTLFAGAREEMQKWKDDTSDWVQKFVDELQQPDFVIPDTESKSSLNQRGQLTRKQLAKIFHEWMSEAAPRMVPPDAFQLYRRLRELGFSDKMIKGVRYFHGFSVKEAPGAAF